jgi:hypothetical protein
MKIISLIFSDSGTKPYLYQSHLWQVLNALTSQKAKNCSLVKNLFFAFQMQYERVQKSLKDQKEKLKEFNTSLDITFNGIVEFVKICSSSKPEALQSAVELTLDLFGEYRNSKNMEMVQQIA